MKIHISLLFAACLFTSCANVPSSYKFDPANDEGLIVGSITYDGSIGLYIMVVSTPPAAPPPKIDVGYSMWPPLGPLFDDGLKTRGGTFAVKATPGTYSIRAWRIKQGYKISQSTSPIDIPFTVERGKTSYIGNLHFSEHWEVSLRDRSERDLPVLQSRYEVLKSAPLAYTITKDTDIKGLGGAYRSSVQMPIFIPIPIGR